VYLQKKNPTLKPYFTALGEYTVSRDEQTQLIAFEERSCKLIYYLHTYTHVCIHR